MPFIGAIRFLDFADILIISALFYQAYKLLIGTRAWNVARGAFALALLWFVATQFQLSATRWLFDRLAPVAFLGAVIIFQPELRAALERMGRGRVARTASRDPVQSIMTAIRELATQRKGALIAIERHTPLQEYGSSGVSVNAAVSAALLQTIFDSKGPLHDGGIIIRGDNIVYASAIFPLSDKNEGWSVKHGTRHRAALGLSEVTDALIIVVSEERGTVSIAQNGVLKTDIAPADVVKTLEAIYSK